MALAPSASYHFICHPDAFHVIDLSCPASHPDYQTYTHGSADDFDRYASYTGDQGWNWNNMQKYIQRVCTLLVILSLSLGSRYYYPFSPNIKEQNEKLVAPADHHNTSGQFIPSVHGYHGAVDVSLPGFPTPLDKRVIASTQETPEFPFNQDMNSGDVLGIGTYILSASLIPHSHLIFHLA